MNGLADLSEENMRKNCPHCDPGSLAYTHVLSETSNFRILCDTHPITEGHILIIPKPHLSCIGAYGSNVFAEFLDLYKKVSAFIASEYGSVATFEHGVFGQSVFHSHVHLMPFSGTLKDIVPDGDDNLSPLASLDGLRQKLEQDGGYLFFSLNTEMWTVNPALASSRFFRDRFATALGVPERGDWKTMHQNRSLMDAGWKENARTMKKWIILNI